MSSITNIHPDAMMEILLARPHRSNVRCTLLALHDLCRKHYGAGLKDFSIACIGRKADEAGLLGYRSLYNRTSQVYRDLIQAWAAYSGPPVISRPKTLASHEYLLKIPDPAIRMIMQATIAERDNLKAEINLLKSGNVGTIDLRPIGAEIMSSSKAGVTAILMPSAQLTEDERMALKASVSPKFLVDEDWFEGERGEIRTLKSNRVVFERGFTSAIRKVLGQPQPGVKVVT